MQDHELERLFERFRRGGDVAALGAIFDATAPELMRVAMSLVAEAAEADDLLQETFLTAIERAGTYDAGRRLVPWLLGILVHHARERRRQRHRAVDPERVAVPAAEHPETPALARELDEALERALADLGAEDRALLEAHLRAGRGAAELAAELGAAPGAVRMRLHRGLDRLRRALPAGLALGGAASAQGLVHVREAVLRAGQLRIGTAGSTPGAGSAAGAGTAGWLMGKKLTLAAALVVAATGIAVLRSGGTRGRDPERDVAALRAPTATAPEDAAEGGSGDGLVPVAQGAPAPAGSRRATPAPTLDPTADRARLSGRVVESDGVPVAGVTVELVEVDESTLFPPLDAAPALPIAARARTAADGTFTLPNADPGAIHALGVDLGGERGTLRILDANLVPGGEWDLGDVVLAPTGAMTGRVVDASGAPVAGARVRVGALPAPVTDLGLEHVVAGGAFANLRTDLRPDYVFEFPAWSTLLESRLPFATTRTDAAGRFLLPRVGAGLLTVLVDAEGHVRSCSGPVPLASGATVDVGTLVLAAGTSARVRVTESGGAAVAGAEVRAGFLAEHARLGVLGPALRAGSDGEAQLACLPEPYVALARRDALGAWATARQGDGGLVAELAGRVERAFQVVDDSGAPVPAPELLLRRRGGGMGVLLPPFVPLDAAERGPGRLDARLEPGSYELRARAAGFADARCELRVESAGGDTTRIVMEPRRALVLHLVDAATGAPLAGARVRVAPGEDAFPAAATSDADGRATLALPSGVATVCLTVEHPRHAPSTRMLEVSDAGGPLEIAVGPGARLVARLARPAKRAYMLQLTRSGDACDAGLRIPRIHAVPPSGELVLERIEPGSWTWNLFEVGSRDVQVLLDPERAPSHLAQGKLELSEGVTSEIVLEADEVAVVANVPGGAGVVGEIRVNGELARDVWITAIPLAIRGGRPVQSGEGSSEQVRAGRFALDVAPGAYVVLAERRGDDDDASVLLAQERITLGEDEVRELIFDVTLRAVRVEVLDAEGAPVPGASVEIVQDGPHSAGYLASGATGPDGRVEIAVAADGPYLVLASHGEHGAANGVTDADGAAVLVLDPGVECSGVLRIADGASGGDDDDTLGTLQVRAIGGESLHVSIALELADGAPFRLRGLRPGRYQVFAWGPSGAFTGELELGASGSSDLEIELAAMH